MTANPPTTKSQIIAAYAAQHGLTLIDIPLHRPPHCDNLSQSQPRSLQEITVMTRTVNHRFDADQLAQLHHQCGESDAPIRDALGYLTLWSLTSYPVVDLLIMGKPGDMEILATYRREDGSIGYTIGAVWHGDHFGFHS